MGLARDRRRGAGGTTATMALSVNRKTLDSDREFEHSARQLLPAPATKDTAS